MLSRNPLISKRGDGFFYRLGLNITRKPLQNKGLRAWHALCKYITARAKVVLVPSPKRLVVLLQHRCIHYGKQGRKARSRAGKA